MADTGNGEKAAEISGNPPMAGDSATSAGSAKRRTKQTVKLTQEEALEIFQQSAIQLQQSGFEVTFSEVHENGVTYSAIILAKVRLINGKLERV